MKTRIRPERNVRFQAFRAARPDLTINHMAAFLKRSVKTVQMWNVGYPGSIPLDTIRLLEMAFPVSDDDTDLIG